MFHAAAKVGDRGPLSELMGLSDGGTQNRRHRARGHPMSLYISSISCRARIGAEDRFWARHIGGRMATTDIRPSRLYGPRDGTTLPWMSKSTNRGWIKLIAEGGIRPNVIHAGSAGEAAFRAARSGRAFGQAYSCPHYGLLRHRQYFNLVAKWLGEPDVTESVPFRAAYTVCTAVEWFGYSLGREYRPLAACHSVWLLGRWCFSEWNETKDRFG